MMHGAERRVNAITGHLNDVARMLLNDLTQDGFLAAKGVLHQIVLLLPERGAAFNIGEQEGDGAGRQVGHRRHPGAYTVDLLPL